eukprot:5943530-Pleurochrysis_carterae.AAC.1
MVKGRDGEWETSRGSILCDTVKFERETMNKIAMKRGAHEHGTRAAQHERHIRRNDCGIEYALVSEECMVKGVKEAWDTPGGGGIQCGNVKHGCATNGRIAEKQRDPQTLDDGCSIDPAMLCTIYDDKTMASMTQQKGTRKSWITFWIWLLVPRFMTWLFGSNIRYARSKTHEKRGKDRPKGGTKASSWQMRKTRERRLIQQRIRIWNRTCIVKYEGKDRRSTDTKSELPNVGCGGNAIQRRRKQTSRNAETGRRKQVRIT